jgi:MFS family permease
LSSFSTTLSGWKIPGVPDAGADQTAFWVLWAAAFIIGASNGLVEICINPLAATLFPENKTHKLNVLHAWWPGGLILAGLIVLLFVDPLYKGSGSPLYQRTNDLVSYTIDPAKVKLDQYVPAVAAWRMKYALLYIPLVLYGLFALFQRFPATERVQARVSWGAMLLQALRPMFLIWAFCMLLTASTELGTNAWMESTLKRTANVSGTLIFIYTSALMFVLRFFAGPIAHKFSPVGMLFFCSILTAGGLYWLSLADNKVTAFAAATVFGIGITYFWPTMLGVTAERFPKGGALLLGLMGCVGNLAIAFATPYMGSIYDRYTGAALPAEVRDMKVDDKALTNPPRVPEWLPERARAELYPPNGVVIDPKVAAKLPEGATERDEIKKAEVSGASNALRVTAYMPALLVVIFGLIAIYDRLRGGYRAVKLPTNGYAGPLSDAFPRYQ